MTVFTHTSLARFVCLATFDVNIVQHFVFKVTKTELFHFYCFASGRCVRVFCFFHHSFLLELIGWFCLSIWMWFSVARLRQCWMRLRRDFPIWVIGPLLLYVIIRSFVHSPIHACVGKLVFMCAFMPYLSPNAIEAMSNIAVSVQVQCRWNTRQTFNFNDREWVR